jgi:DNA polymerase-3 subunit epsilon
MYPSEFTTATNHNYDMDERGHWVCRTCGHSEKIDRGGICIGVPIYWKWEDIPDGMATKTTLYKKHGLKLSPNQPPVGAKVQYNRKGKVTGGYHPLYAISEATPKKKATPEQLVALEKARHMAERLVVRCSQCGEPEETPYDYVRVTRKQWLEGDYDNHICEHCSDKLDAMNWANEIQADQNAVILDTETTDLDGEIIEIAIINMTGEVLFNQRIKPLSDISPGAYAVHGISLDDLKDEPQFPDVYPQLVELLKGKTVVIYNAVFDKTILQQDCLRHKLKGIPFRAECAMLVYSQFVGEWSNYHEDYRWQKLWGGDHTALGDCKATLKVIQEMGDHAARMVVVENE